uniref:C2H2-type domain-containing protein n=1 Tax=Octactis speculum TaxID=3111310 RepID=A0A7S2H3I5_9STRA|mmetsp:Transcript_61047/g.83830  ORF Transcript_61047/g.83830 Transcript_61047/m.83830 type:complete len:346 (+) Transcript_61047:211-1248(+)|eukprot:CAMPEP_0185798450 /NCGR_PEP_ID=MMETSP1174-20130828/162157_1 /TAXON_ID=35687 /ORGANISM="Dictyocha speculum, Strain CCMP1381" /LENGTH=345 /DNA_ID=CAMNT_0028493951 /DNA_START=674 /DNA_END=1711 /DNA_ORIENTATION=-
MLLANPLLRSVEVQRNGLVVFLSVRRVEEAASRGEILCIDCARFFRGARGLRWHRMTMHEESYEDAREAGERQLVVYQEPPHGGGPHTMPDYAESGGGGEGGETVGSDVTPVELVEKRGQSAAKEGNLELLKQLIDEGLEPARAADRFGCTCLLWAAGGGHIHICAYLIDHCGVPWSQRQHKDGRTALHWAARNGHVAACAFFKSRGADLDDGTFNGTTAFHWAASKSQREVCAWLIHEGADVSRLNKYGCNAIQWVAQSGDLGMCRWLMEKGVDVGLVNRNNHSCLHKAAIKNRMEVCRWLLEEVKLTPHIHMAADSDGQRPSTMAQAQGFYDLARYLRSFEDS